MRKYFTLIFTIFIFFQIQSYAQVNYNLTPTAQKGYDERCSDVWGYVDENGEEYAILGTQTGTAIIALDRTDTLQELFFIPGTPSTWRDMKSYNKHVYVTSDVGMDGLLIIDMSHVADDSISYHFWRPELNLNGENLDTLNRCHNIYADDNGYAYLAGCRNYGGGVLIFDLVPNPDTPQLVGASDRIYAHDCFVRDDRLFTSDIFAGQVSIYDVSDKTAPQLMARQSTSGNFTHNAWSSEDNNYVFTTDEITGGFVDAYDISDTSDIQRLDTWRPDSAFEKGIIPHNTHVLNDFLVTSWYIEGLIVLDASQPDNLVPVARYDTYLGDRTRFQGAWGAYPFLPSGRILVSDINSGLFVFEPSYVRAARLEGVVTDIITGEKLNGVKVTIEDTLRNSAQTTADGSYQTGTAFFGEYIVSYQKDKYRIHRDTLEFVEGQTLMNDVQLSPDFNFYSWDLLVRDSTSLEELEDVQLKFIGADSSVYDRTTNANGQLIQPLIPEGTYDIFIGKWGFEELVLDSVIIAQDRTDTVYLVRGYQDHFNLDLNWTSTGDASSGFWVRDIPAATEFDGRLVNPGSDSQEDRGEYAYVTGNNAAGGAGFDDIDDGFVELTSPWMDLSNYQNTEISFNYWFFTDGGNTDPDDTLVVTLSSPERSLEVVKFGVSRSEWVPFSFVLDSIWQGEKDSLKISFTASDQEFSGHLVEAGLDVFNVSGDILSTSYQPIVREVSIYPNPTADLINIQYDMDYPSAATSIRIFDRSGKMVKNWNSAERQLWVNELPEGVYYLELTSGSSLYQGKFTIIRP